MQRDTCNMTRQKIIVFGTGSASVGIEHVCREARMDIICFADNAHGKTDTTLYGKPIIHPDKIKNTCFDKIVIASSFVGEIEEQLLTLGIPREKILLYPGINSVRGMYNLFDSHHLHRNWNTLILPITNRCNLKCAHCSRSNFSLKQLWTLERSVFRYYLSRFERNNFKECCISGDGEATLVANLPAYLLDARDLGWRNLSIITNGTCQNQHMLEKILAGNLLQSITISLEAVTDELFRRFRGFPFARFLEFLKTIASLKKKYASSVTTHFNVTCCRLNLHEMPYIVELAAEYHIETVSFNHLLPLFREEHATAGTICTPHNTFTSNDLPQIHKIFRDVQQLADFHNIQLVNLDTFLNYPGVLPAPEPSSQDDKDFFPTLCNFPFQVVKVEPDGNVYPCCPMPLDHPLGNLNNADFLQIWQESKYRDLLNKLRGNNASLPLCCRGCFERMTQKKAFYCWRTNQAY